MPALPSRDEKRDRARASWPLIFLVYYKLYTRNAGGRAQEQKQKRSRPNCARARPSSWTAEMQMLVRVRARFARFRLSAASGSATGPLNLYSQMKRGNSCCRPLQLICFLCARVPAAGGSHRPIESTAWKRAALSLEMKNAWDRPSASMIRAIRCEDQRQIKRMIPRPRRCVERRWINCKSRGFDVPTVVGRAERQSLPRAALLNARSYG